MDSKGIAFRHEIDDASVMASANLFCTNKIEFDGEHHIIARKLVIAYYLKDYSLYNEDFLSRVIKGTVTQDEFDRNTQARSES